MEKQVIIAAQKGDLEAFKKIFDFYLPRMRTVCLRYIQSEFDADDVLQESFIKVYRYLNSFNFGGSFEGWIRRIVVNTALNYITKNKNNFLIEDIDNVADQELSTEEALLIEETEVSSLFKIVESLPPGYKIIFKLYVLEDYSHKEIAEMLSISEGSSRSQYFKAKKLINKLLLRQRKEDKSSLSKNKDEK